MAVSNKMTRSLHWFMAVFLIGLIALGFYMTTAEDHSVYALHKSLGVIALALILFRIVWRLRYPWESSMKGTSQERLVKRIHWLLIIFIVLMPVSGLMLSGLGGYGVAVFGLQIIPDNYSAEGQALPYSPMLSALGYQLHEIFAYAFSALIVGHVLAALKHHFIDKDDTLRRMLGVKPR